MGATEDERPSKRPRKTGQEGKERRKRAVFFLGFVGEGYHGMQKNPGCQTIEGDLIDAATKAGALGDKEQKKFHLANWTRSARTDKGVSAASQVVAMNVPPETGPEIVHAINENLPESIRIYGMLTATHNFTAKDHCVRRQYEYLIPAKTLVRELAQEEPIPALVERFNGILAKFVGTHLFHNFTENKLSKDPSCQRFVTSVTCNADLEIHGTQIIKVTVIGQSFLLHMIRKIIGLAILVLLGTAPEETIVLAFDKEQRLRFPMAPALGLLLDRCFFDTYNRKFEASLAKSISPEHFESAAESFKREKIYLNIVKRDLDGSVMKSWIENAKKSADLDTEQIMADFRMLDRPDITREQKRKERIESCYPIFESFRGFYNWPEDESHTDDMEERKKEVTHIRDLFVKQFAEEPLLYCRVPSVVFLFGANFLELELPCMGLAGNHDTVVAMTRETPGSKDQQAKVVFVKYSSPSEFQSTHLKIGGARLASGTIDPWSKWVSWGWTGPTQSDSVDGRAKLVGAKCLISSNAKEHGGNAANYAAAASLAVSRTNRWRLPKLEIASTVEKMLRKNGHDERPGNLSVAMTAERGCISKCALGPQQMSKVTRWTDTLTFVELNLGISSYSKIWEEKLAESKLAAGLFAKKNGAKAWKTVTAGRLTRFFNKSLDEIIEMIDIETELSLEEASSLVGEPMDVISQFSGVVIGEKERKVCYGKRLRFVLEECKRMDEVEKELERGELVDKARLGSLLSIGHERVAADFEIAAPEVENAREWLQSRSGVMGSRGMVWAPESCRILCIVSSDAVNGFITECGDSKYGKDAAFSAQVVGLRQGSTTWHVQQSRGLLD